MSRIGNILSHSIEACGVFWRAFTGRESSEDLIEREEVRLRTLRIAIGLYHAKYGRFPAILRDLCDNNYDDPEWGGPFIPWSGEDTFRDSFGYRYEYEAVAGRSRVVSLGLERAMTAPDDIRAFISRKVAEQLPQIEPAGLRDWIAARLTEPYQTQLSVDAEGTQLED